MKRKLKKIKWIGSVVPEKIPQIVVEVTIKNWRICCKSCRAKFLIWKLMKRLPMKLVYRIQKWETVQLFQENIRIIVENRSETIHLLLISQLLSSNPTKVSPYRFHLPPNCKKKWQNFDKISQSCWTKFVRETKWFQSWFR